MPALPSIAVNSAAEDASCCADAPVVEEPSSCCAGDPASVADETADPVQACTTPPEAGLPAFAAMPCCSDELVTAGGGVDITTPTAAESGAPLGATALPPATSSLSGGMDAAGSLPGSVRPPGPAALPLVLRI